MLYAEFRYLRPRTTVSAIGRRERIELAPRSEQSVAIN